MVLKQLRFLIIGWQLQVTCLIDNIRYCCTLTSQITASKYMGNIMSQGTQKPVNISLYNNTITCNISVSIVQFQQNSSDSCDFLFQYFETINESNDTKGNMTAINRIVLGVTIVTVTLATIIILLICTCLICCCLKKRRNQNNLSPISK